MPALDPRFVLMQPLQDIFLDKDSGAPLSAGVVTFYVDNGSTTSTVLKDIYQISLSPSNEYQYTVLNNPVTLTSIGTFADDDGNDILPYLYPYTGSPDDPTTGEVELYYITVDSSTGVRQFTRSAFPNVSDIPSPSDEDGTGENIISNPQFVEVSFSPLSSTTITLAGPSDSTLVAPGWYIDTTGTGTLTISQLDLTDTNIPSNPSFALQIITSGAGLTGNVILRQRFANSPRLFNKEYVAGSFVAASGDASDVLLIYNYVPSHGTTYEICRNVANASLNYDTIFGTSELISSGNDNPGSTGYIDIQLVIPTGANVVVTSFQVIGVSNENVVANFIQQSADRQIDHLFHYYKDSILIMPKDTICVGWEFGLNPWQFSPKNLTNFPYVAGTIGYCADQTIIALEQSNSIQVGQGITGVDGKYLEIKARAATTQGQIAIIQYIDKFSAAPYFNKVLSALVRLRLQTGAVSSIRFKMRIITSATAPATLSGSEPISAWGGDPTFSGQWTVIVPQNDPIYTVTSSTVITDDYFAFNNFQMPNYTSMRYIGIVLYTLDGLDNNAPDSLLIREISVTPNEFAIDCNPKTYDQTLRECEFYYEKTYNDGNLVSPITGIGSTTINGALYARMTGQTSLGSAKMNTLGFSSEFSTEKCITPTLKFYSPNTGAADNVYALYYIGATIKSADIATTNWTTNVTTKSYTSLNNNTYTAVTIDASASNPDETYIRYHYVADARLGQ